MSTKQIEVKQNANSIKAIWGAVILAALTALAYFLVSQHVLAIGHFSGDEGPKGFFYITTGGYLLGGLLILARRRWLWIIGAVINVLAVVFFIVMYANQTGVLFSPGGIATKVAQICLEGFLFYLIFTYRGKKPVTQPK